jgi:beta-galactosidase
VLQDDNDWVIGEFVWTGFDYLGEPTPYDDRMNARSSYFGIFDLAGLPKDRYWLYRSHWNKDAETIHLLPHWTWPGREGEVTPVYCYTNYPSAELFVNGKSQGRISKRLDERVKPDGGRTVKETEPLIDRYRLRWNNVVYEPGEIRVVVYDANGVRKGESVCRTAGAPYRLVVTQQSLDEYHGQKTLRADGEDMAFFVVSAVDKEGNLCPEAEVSIQVEVSGAADFKGICNGDPTSFEVFTRPTMKLFKGQLVVGIISNGKKGTARVSVQSNGLLSATAKMKVK